MIIDSRPVGGSNYRRPSGKQEVRGLVLRGKDMDQTDDKQRVSGFAAVFLMVFTCALPYVILWFLLDLSTNDSMFSILLISVAVLGYLFWNAVYVRLMTKKY
jgi:hypothetical protein